MSDERVDSRGAPPGSARRVWVVIAGWTLVVSGAALFFLPGPGLPLLVAGLALLGKERPWARRLLSELRRRGRHLFRRGSAEAPEAAIVLSPKVAHRKRTAHGARAASPRSSAVEGVSSRAGASGT